ncbi:MAG: class I SAM-dependent methyltransferase [Bacteroidota bacterium]
MIEPGVTISSTDVSRHYDDLDPYYRALWGEYLHHGLFTSRREGPEQAVLNLLDHLFAHLEVSPGSAVCDVGCGYGTTAAHLVDRYHCNVSAITLSRSQYERALGRSKRLSGEVRFVHGDWLTNPFDDNEFDSVIAIESLAHMTDKAAFFREAARVLRPGGRLGIYAWLAPQPVGAFQRNHLLEPICREGRLPSMGSMEEYLFMMRRAGLEPMLMEDLSRKVRRTWSVIGGRLARRIAVDRHYRRMILDPSFSNRIFALTVLRMMVAFRTGAMKYGLLTAEKPLRETAA